MSVHVNIKGLLLKRQKTLRWLETKTGISYQALWSMKQHRTSKIEFETISKLLEALNCEPNDLFVSIKEV